MPEHEWKVTHTPPEGSPTEPDEVTCTQCGLVALRWCGTLLIAIPEVVNALATRPPVDTSTIPRVDPVCSKAA